MVARYGQLHDDDLPELTRARLLTHLLAEAFTRSGIDSRETRAAGARWPGVVVTLDAITYLIQLVWSTKPTRRETIEELAESAQAQHGVRLVLASMAGYEPAAAHQVQALHPSGITLMDRTHIEAILCGLIEPGLLITRAAHRSIFDGRSYSTLTDLLLGEARQPAPAQLIRADRLPPPWPLQNDAGAEGAAVRHLFTGDDGWPDPQGITVVDPAHALVTVPDGILTVDLKHGTTDWLLPVAGCRGTALAAADGSVLTLCADAVIRWRDDAVTVVGGGFPDARALLFGPDNRPWVLSGHGTHFGSGTATLALTRLDGTPGGQHRHRIHFDADVHTAGWLEDLRFFLAAPGNSAVVDLARSIRVRRDDWIETPHSRPDHLVVADPNHVITASSHSSGVRATVYRTNVTTAISTLVADLALNHVKGMAAASSRLLLLGDVRGNDVYVPHPVLVTIHEASSHGPGEPVGTTTPEQSAITTTEPGQHLHTLPTHDEPVDSATKYARGPADPYASVRLAARGERRDYAMAPKPIASGGQATVFQATHKTTGIHVALKRLQTRNENDLARMRREVDAARRYGNHPNVVPVLDFGSTGEWFVMPLAQDTAGSLSDTFHSDEVLCELVTSICHALREPHQDGWIHRDLKPDNILRLGDRWAVADWGLGRRPRGQTTDPRRTRVGGAFGTEGFAAPELAINAHVVGPPTDIYSIGQIVGWAKLNRLPQANVPLLPDSGPWRTIAKAATHTDPARRPATVDELLALIARELDEPAEDPTSHGERLLAAIRSGDPTGIGQLVDLAVRNAGHYDLYLNVLVQLGHDPTEAAAAANPPAMREIVRGVLDLDGGNGVTLEYGDVDQLITWLLIVARHAETCGEWDLLEDTADSIFYLDLWDRWAVQSDISAWMAGLSGHAASVVAEALRRNPENRPHFTQLATNRRVDHRIRRAFDG